MRLSSILSSGSSPQSKYAKKGYVHVASAKYTWTGKSSIVGAFSFACAGGFEVVRFGLIDLCSLRKKRYLTGFAIW